MKEWLQKRIDYWETVVEQDAKKSQDALDARDISEAGYHEGILQGFYEAIEYLEGQRR